MARLAAEWGVMVGMPHVHILSLFPFASPWQLSSGRCCASWGCALGMIGLCQRLLSVLSFEDGPRIASIWWSGGVGGGAGLGRGSRVLTWVDGEMVLNSALCLTKSWASVELLSYFGSLFSMWEMLLPMCGKCHSLIVYM